MKYITMFMAAVILVAGGQNTAKASELVVVDIAQLESESNAGKDLRKKIKAKRDALKAEVSKEEMALREKQTKLMEEKKTLSPEDFQSKVKAFEANFRDKQAKIAKKREAFEKSAMEAHAKLRSKVVEAVGEISTEKKYKLVLSRQSVVIVEKSVDITADAMTKLNDKVKSIPLK